MLSKVSESDPCAWLTAGAASRARPPIRAAIEAAVVRAMSLFPLQRRSANLRRFAAIDVGPILRSCALRHNVLPDAAAGFRRPRLPVAYRTFEALHPHLTIRAETGR